MYKIWIIFSKVTLLLFNKTLITGKKIPLVISLIDERIILPLIVKAYRAGRSTSWDIPNLEIRFFHFYRE